MSGEDDEDDGEDGEDEEDVEATVVRDHQHPDHRPTSFKKWPDASCLGLNRRTLGRVLGVKGCRNGVLPETLAQ